MEDAGPYLCGDLGSPVGGIAIYNQTSVTISAGRSAKTRPIDCASLCVGMTTDTRTGSRLNSTTMGRTASAAPATRQRPTSDPLGPTASASDAITGTSSSQIQAVPHSDTQRLPRYRNATNGGRARQQTDDEQYP